MTEHQGKIEMPPIHAKEETLSPDAMTQLLKNILKPLLIAGIFDTAALRTPNASTLIPAANLALFAALALQAAYTRKESREKAVISGVVSGGIIGIILGITKLILVKKFWSFLTLITSPILWLVVGGMSTAVVYTIAKRLEKKEEKDSKQTHA